MNHLTILSRDAQTYATLLGDLSPTGLVVEQVTDNPADVRVDQVSMLLSEPDLAAQIIQDCPRLQWLQSTWAGNAPLIKHSKTDYTLTAVKGIFGRTMREYVATYLLHFSRNVDAFHPRVDSRQRAKPMQWRPPAVSTLRGKCLGVLGAGDIAANLIELAKCFDMRIIGLNRRGESEHAFDAMYSAQQAQDFAQQCDYLVCLLPDTPATTHFINGAFLSQLKHHCVLINAGRGNSIEQQALLDALNRGQLSAAVLDVFETEPLPEHHPFWQHDKIWITQHTAAISNPADVIQVFCENYQRWQQQESLLHQIDFEQGY